MFLFHLCDTSLDDKNSSGLLFKPCAPSSRGLRGVYLCMFGGWRTTGTQRVLNQYLLRE